MLAMPLFAFEGRRPEVDPTAFIAPTATLVGEVTVEANASVWYGAVIRADFGPVIVRAGANVQDGAVLHGPAEIVTEVGPGATVAHLCVVHGAVLGEECLVANGAIVLDGASVGARSLIAAGAVVTPGTQIPDGVLAAGIPARVRGPIAGTPAEVWVNTNPQIYQELAHRHRSGITPL
jgi:carbonic anhydrase/acetyltransferase-like protein (isoleucine patch superfamily)